MKELVQLVNDAATSALIAWLNTLAVTAAVAIVASVCLRSRRLNAATRHVVWWGVVLFIVAAPIVYCVANRPAPPVAVDYARTAEPFIPVATSIHVPADTQAAPPPRSLPVDWTPGPLPLTIALIWAALLAVQMVRVLWSYRWLARLKREAQPAPAALRNEFDEWVLATAVRRPVRLLVSDVIESPVAVGFRNAAVVLPASMVDELERNDTEHVILHELAHISRRDDWTNLLARVLTGALSLNPVALLALRRIDAEREIACDDWVVTVTGTARDYAVSLSRLVELRFGRRDALLASGVGRQLSERIALLLESGRTFTCTVSPGRAGAALLVLAIAMFAGTAAPPWIASAQEPATTPEPPESPDAPAAATRAPRPRRATTAARATRAQAAPAPGVRRPSAPPPPPAPVAAVPQAITAAGPPRASESSLLGALVANGYGGLSVDEIIQLKNTGVTAEYLSAMVKAWGKLPANELMQARRHGLSADYAARMRAAGFRDLTLSNVMLLRLHGVDPEQIREIHALGFGPYTVGEATELRNRGVPVQFFQALKDSGFGRAELRDIIDARLHGVRPEHLREAAKIGSSLTLRQIVRLKQAGVI
jgi:beta-lactamase regulating signal transducer with metallopeptidase domain